MATVLTVHVIDTIWSRRRDRGLVAPFLVVDHNGEQQQTEIKKVSTTTTAWNQKATFAYAPTSDLVIMAFDALGQDGDFLGQAVVDVAAMLQDGRLHARAPIVSSTGRTVGEVTFDVALSTSSSVLAASLDIPCLTISTTATKANDKKYLRNSALQDKRMSEYSSPFAATQVQTGHIRQQLHQQHSISALRASTGSAQLQAADMAEATSIRVGHKLSGLGQMLGLSLAKRRSSEGGVSSPAKPTTPASLMAAASRSSMDSSIELPAGTGPLLARHSLLRSSQCSSSGPSAPPATASIAAASSAALQNAIQAATAAGSDAVATGGLAIGARASSAASEAGVSRNAGVHQRQSHASDTNSTVSRNSRLGEVGDDCKNLDHAGHGAASRDLPLSPAPRQPCRTSQVPRLSVPAAATKAVDGPLSPLRSNRPRLNLVPKQAPLSPHDRRIQRQQQLHRDLERLQHMVLQEAAVHPVLQQGGAYGSSGLIQQSDITSGFSSEDDQLLQEYQTADAAGKEAILYKQLMLQQAERTAGSAQLLRLLAAQQQQEALREAHLLASLSSMSPDSSPRKLNPSSGAALGGRLSTAAVGGNRMAAWPGKRSHYPEIPVPCSPDGTPVKACHWPADDQYVEAQGTGGSDGSSGDGSSIGDAEVRRRYYPEVPAGNTAAASSPDSRGKRGSRKQWSKPHVTEALEHSPNLEVWQSCDSASETASPVSDHVSSRSSVHTASVDAAVPGVRRSPGKQSRLFDGVSSKDRDVRSYPVMEAHSDSAHGDNQRQSPQPAYVCRKSLGNPAAFSCVRNLPADVPVSPRWCKFPVVDAVSYPAPGIVYPFQAVPVEPSAPPV